MRELPVFEGERILSGTGLPDDAGVYRLTDDLALVQSVDFFAPVVNDPYDFGRIAAANALSDLYAMGATPLTALALAGFPKDTLPLENLVNILRGGMDKAREADCAVIGGHTIDDREPKYGLAVTGTVDPKDIWYAHTARPGDVLVLTKPLGTGIIATAIKKKDLEGEAVARATAVMAALNRDAAEAAREAEVHAVTDVTGFGLIGHLSEMARLSGVTARIGIGALPVLAETRELIAEKVIPGGTLNNLEFVRPRMRVESGVTHEQTVLAADAQTSGGLLIAVAPKDADRLVEELRARKTPAAAVIGEILPREGGTDIVLTP